MYAEYKRDVSHNYLILREEEKVNTASSGTNADGKCDSLYIKVQIAGTGRESAVLL